MSDENIQNNKDDLKVLRTYSSDMAEMIRNNEMSVIKIALAEKEKRDKESINKEYQGTTNKKIFFVIGGLILIASAIVVVYFFIQKQKNAIPFVNVVKNPETFLSYDLYKNIRSEDIINKDDLLKIIPEDLEKTQGKLIGLFLTKNEEELITTKEFFKILNINIPQALINSMSDKFLFGKYINKNYTNEKGESNNFLVFQTNDYNQAYASLLDWEDTMYEDLKEIFYQTNNTTSSNWKDLIVNNKDTRVLYNQNGEIILYYAFVNKKTFVITNNIETIKEVITRLIIKNY